MGFFEEKFGNCALYETDSNKTYRLLSAILSLTSNLALERMTRQILP